MESHSHKATKLSFSETVPAGFIRRTDFGNDFLFGSTTSAFQIEGGLKKGGRRPSIFDGFAHDRDLFKPYGPDAINHYEHYKEDVKLMKEIGFNSYKFSIAWSRILPTGKPESRSQEGINFYKNLIKNLKEEGIVPVATLVHFDPPQDLEDDYYTFLDSQIVEDFKNYADICFHEFGNDVKYWVTITEPWYVAYGGYITNALPPAYAHPKDYESEQEKANCHWHSLAKKPRLELDQKQSPQYGPDFSSLAPPIRSSIQAARTMSLPARTPPSAGLLALTHKTRGKKELPEEARWPYIVAHNMILAHAEAVHLYREKYQKAQNGKIGMNFVIQWYEPLHEEKKENESYEEAKVREKKNRKNKEACQRAVDFMFGWFMEPLYRGDYPKSMRDCVTKGHLPEFTPHEKMKIKGAYDFLSINYYTSLYVSDEDIDGGDYVLDRRVRFHDKNPLGSVQGAAGWINGYPKGILEYLLYIKHNYNNPDIYIHENGFDDMEDDTMAWNSFHDQKRILYLHDHLVHIKEAIRQGVKVKGHYVWSLMDNLELALGYKDRFGLTYIDYQTSRRIPKYSASWFKNFLAN